LILETPARDTLQTVTDNHCQILYVNFEFKCEIIRRLNLFSYNRAIELIDKQANFEEALVYINKCLLFKPYHIPFYEIRSEIYLNLCDFHSSILNLQKSILYTQETTNKNLKPNSRLSNNDEQQITSVSVPVTPGHREDQLTNDKIAFLRYLSGVSLFDQKLYLEALSIIATGANIFSTLPFQIYRYFLFYKFISEMMIYFFSILCLTALNKIDEASTLITQLIDQYPQNADLLIIRARLYFKDKTKVNQLGR